MGVDKVEIYGDSRLVVEQINGDSQCLDGVLNEYRERCLAILGRLKKFSVEHVPQGGNEKPNRLAQQASGYDIRHGRFTIEWRLTLHAIFVIQGEGDESAGSDQASTRDWRQELIRYINGPSCTRDQKIRRQALKYTVIDGKLFF
jgi:hypothetical protein